MTKENGKRSKESHLIPDVRDQRQLIAKFLDTRDERGRKIGDAICGVYAFFDFDGAAIYVGQTKERIRTRVRRHLTNRRTDAVAMKVLDPMEVAEIQIWPFWNLQDRPGELDKKAFAGVRAQMLDAAEWTVYATLSESQQIIDILNEKLPPKRPLIDLPPSHKGSIVAEASKERLCHADERIARRASTIASLTSIIKERDVSLGLRRTLVTQAARLHRLALTRFEDIKGEIPQAEVEHELTGSEPDSDAEESE